MPTQISELVHSLRAAALRDGAGRTDGELLELFVEDGNEDALAALVTRHGPMVWGVCRRILHGHHDAEDAFQATFLVFVRKAASLRQKDLLANWLFGVAQQTALRARASTFKKFVRERQVREMPERSAATQDIWEDVQPLLDEELRRLPAKYRALIVMCDLEGKTRREVARELTCPEGTVAGRLARARAMLAKRLGRRIAVSAGVLGALLSTHTAMAAPAELVSTTIQAASLVAAGHATAAGAISAKAAALSEGVMKAMLMTKLKLGAIVAAVLVALAIGGGALHQCLADTPTVPPDVQPAVLQDTAVAQREQPKDAALLKGKIGAIDVANRSITLVTTTFDRKLAEATEKEHVLTLAKNAVITQDGAAAKLEDLKRGFMTTVKVDQKTALAVTVDGAAVKGQFKSINTERNTITVAAGRDMGEKIYHLLKSTKVTTDKGKAGKVQDLQPGSEIILTLSVLGDNTVIQIQPTVVEKKKRGDSD